MGMRDIGKIQDEFSEWFAENEKQDNSEIEEFSANVEFNNMNFNVRWKGGKIDDGSGGDSFFVKLLSELAEGSQVIISLTPTGPAFKNNLLDDPLSARAMIQQLADSVIDWSGDLPVIPVLTEGDVS